MSTDCVLQKGVIGWAAEGRHRYCWRVFGLLCGLMVGYHVKYTRKVSYFNKVVYWCRQHSSENGVVNPWEETEMVSHLLPENHFANALDLWGHGRLKLVGARSIHQGYRGGGWKFWTAIPRWTRRTPWLPVPCLSTTWGLPQCYPISPAYECEDFPLVTRIAF